MTHFIFAFGFLAYCYSAIVVVAHWGNGTNSAPVLKVYLIIATLIAFGAVLWKLIQ